MMETYAAYEALAEVIGALAGWLALLRTMRIKLPRRMTKRV